MKNPVALQANNALGLCDGINCARVGVPLSCWVPVPPPAFARGLVKRKTCRALRRFRERDGVEDREGSRWRGKP